MNALKEITKLTHTKGHANPNHNDKYIHGELHYDCQACADCAPLGQYRKKKLDGRPRRNFRVCRYFNKII